LLYAVILAHPPRNAPQSTDAAGVLQIVRDSVPPVLQIGGDETTGKGFCSIRVTTPEGGAK
jgi:CRISPR-associated protein Cmr4